MRIRHVLPDLVDDPALTSPLAISGNSAGPRSAIIPGSDVGPGWVRVIDTPVLLCGLSTLQNVARSVGRRQGDHFAKDGWVEQPENCHGQKVRLFCLGFFLLLTTLKLAIRLLR